MKTNQTTTLTNITKPLTRTLGWIISLIMLIIAITQYQDTRSLHEQLVDSQQRIRQSQEALSRARTQMDTMMVELEGYRHRDAAINQRIEGMVGRWRSKLLDTKNYLGSIVQGYELALYGTRIPEVQAYIYTLLQNLDLPYTIAEQGAEVLVLELHSATTGLWTLMDELEGMPQIEHINLQHITSPW